MYLLINLKKMGNRLLCLLLSTICMGSHLCAGASTLAYWSGNYVFIEAYLKKIHLSFQVGSD